MFHLRFTPDGISGYTFDFLEKFGSYIIAFENKDEYGDTVADHYHILIDTDYGDKSLRDAIKASLKIPKSTRGKNNTYYALFPDWNDPGYICKWGDIRAAKGYTPEQVMEYVNSGRKKYLKIMETDELSGEVAPASSSTNSKAKTQSVDRLVNADILKWYYEQKAANPDFEPNRRETIEKVCDLYRKYDKGINVFKIRDAMHTFMYDIETYRSEIIEKIYSMV